MSDLAEELEERLRDRVHEADEFIRDQLRQVDEGVVKDSVVPATVGLAARKAESAAVGHLYYGEIAESREYYRRAADLYRRSAAAARERPPYSNSYRKLPMTLTKALYAATLAGEPDLQSELATEIMELDPEDGVESVDDVVFHPDKYYLARCVAEAVRDEVAEGSVALLEAVNAEKSEPERLYGDAVVELARGVARADRGLVESGVGAAVDYHERTMDPEHAVDHVVARLATVLHVVARQRGYDIDVGSEFVPTELVAASAEG